MGVPRFTNLDGSAMPHGLGSVLRWKLGLYGGPKLRTPARAEVPIVDNRGTALRRAIDPALTWIGHATYLVQLGGRTILTDPVYARRLAVIPRNAPPGVAMHDLPRIDFVTVSHNHRDHMDVPTLRRIGPEAIYVVPAGCEDLFRRAGLRRVVPMRWWQEEEIEGVRVTFVPAQHWSRRGLLDENTSLWGGFVLEREGVRVYHSGDTAWFDGFAQIGRRVGPIHAAMLPIGAYEPRWFMRTQHMNPEDAVAAFTALRAERFFAMHWGTFKLTDEALDEPPLRLRQAWDEAGVALDRQFIPAIGETIRL